MTVSRKAVIWAYRLLLDRYPETDVIIEGYRGLEDHASLRRAILASEEYRAKESGPLRIGRYLDDCDISVEVDSSPEQLAAMLARIAGEWRRFGETDPHWSVLVGDKFRAEHIDEHIDEFYASGRGDVAHLLNPLARAGLPTQRLGTVLDFGCGVGRLSLTLAAHAEEVIGVDISPGHVALANQRADEVGIQNASFVAIDAADDLDRFRNIDLVVSLIVLQHNPPPVMAVLLGKLLAMLTPGGVAVLQLPTFIENQRFAVSDYLTSDQPSMEMNALPQKNVFEIVEAAGCRVLEVREDGRIGDYPGISQVFAIRKLPT